MSLSQVEFERWLPRAEATIAKAEAILEERADPAEPDAQAPIPDTGGAVDSDRARSLLLLSAHQASVALEAILRTSAESFDLAEANPTFSEEETLEKLLDAAKLMIEARGAQGHVDHAAIYTTLGGFLAGWPG